jgi:hypothetical protein
MCSRTPVAQPPLNIHHAFVRTSSHTEKNGKSLCFYPLDIIIMSRQCSGLFYFHQKSPDNVPMTWSAK